MAPDRHPNAPEPTNGDKTKSRESHDSRESDVNPLGGEESRTFHFGQEAGKLLHVGIPSVLMQFAMFWIFPLSASAVGRQLGTVDLAGFSLGSLIGNMTCLSIMEGSLTAADTLMPRAYGAERYRALGCLAIRAMAVGLFLLSIPVVPLCLYSEWVLTTLGQDPEASAMAQSWIQMYLIGALPNLLFRVLMRFLLSQHRPWPLVFSSVIPSLVIHPFLLNYFVPLLGFRGSALSIALTQWITLMLLLLHLSCRPVYHPETWPGFSWELVKEALEWKSTLRFLKLGLGGVLSMNEWWFFEIMCFIAGSFGVESIDAHTIAYNLVPLFFMLPLGVSIGLAVRMGNVIAYDPRKARLLAAYCMACMSVVGVMVSLMLHFLRLQIIQLFTNDQEVIELAVGIWPSLCYYMFLIYIMGISLAILRALGMQWRAAGIISGSLYAMTLPAVLYFAVYLGGGLLAQWRVLPVCYTILQVVLALGYLVVDWDQHAKKVRASIAQMSVRDLAELENKLPTEETPLLVV